jgi:hypothetical protein
MYTIFSLHTLNSYFLYISLSCVMMQFFHSSMFAGLNSRGSEAECGAPLLSKQYQIAAGQICGILGVLS